MRAFKSLSSCFHRVTDEAIVIVTFFLIIFLASCRNDRATLLPDYEQEIMQWRQQRLDALMAPDSWLALAGLYWLQPGENSFGSDSSNQLVFPAKAPDFMGYFYQYPDSVVMRLSSSHPAAYQDSSITQFTLSGHASPPLIRQGDLSWVLLQRGRRYGVRLWDSRHPKLQDTVQIEYFPLDPTWRIAAEWKQKIEKDTILMRNVLGMELPIEVEGSLQFDRDGNTYELLALDGGADELFLIFADATTGETTYSGGRYLYVPRPDSIGTTFIDFNKAYNPPCAFTDYATCLLPPAANRLVLPVEAGEKSYGEH